MSAPDTNTEKQARQHRGPLTGMLMMVIWAAVLLVALILYLTLRGGDPEGAAAQVDGRTGDAEETDAGAVASDNATPAPAGESDAAVEVPAETTTAPDTGAGNVADTDPGESQAAEPLNPADDEGAGTAPAEDAAAEE